MREGLRLYRLLRANDFEGLRAALHSLLAGIPYQWRVRNRIADYEGSYASVFLSAFLALGFDVRVEDASSRGRVDMAVRFHGNVYLFEFKVVEKGATGGALAQLKTKGYAEKYRGLGGAGPPGRGGVQQGDPEPGGVRRGAGLRWLWSKSLARWLAARGAKRRRGGVRGGSSLPAKEGGTDRAGDSGRRRWRKRPASVRTIGFPTPSRKDSQVGRLIHRL